MTWRGRRSSLLPGRRILVRRAEDIAVTVLFDCPAAFLVATSVIFGSMRSLGVHSRMSHNAMRVCMLNRCGCPVTMR
ncbi:hypothetical protein I553_7046 [Mycobacterium xenopi 4042]|uniref:Uncharacterized protein n=1 Tax=Mycobacterium xenopi 4042 TaxID=1299334 RepID=X7Z4G4_MYCXE|nr:hypothetical protein I553_7046 [Mycobacterium xenopi 4042]